jgi:hypothetical protein
MNTKTNDERDEQPAEDTAGHAFETERRVVFPDLLAGKTAMDLLAKKRLVREIQPGVIDGRRRIAG